MLLDPTFWRSISLGIDADDQKIQLLVHHNLSRGIAREAILRKLLVQQTPHPYRVSTGFIYSPDPQVVLPKQCDVLVHDLTGYQPYFQIDEFIVATQRSTKVICEVKSSLNTGELTKVVDMHMYSHQFGINTLGFAFSGLTFDNFFQAIFQLMQQRQWHELPPCIAVHEQNYVGMRGMNGAGDPCYVAVNFNQVKGMGVAYFMNYYDSILRNTPIDFATMRMWFNDSLPAVPPANKVWITPAGVTNGNIP